MINMKIMVWCLARDTALNYREICIIVSTSWEAV